MTHDVVGEETASSKRLHIGGEWERVKRKLRPPGRMSLEEVKLEITYVRRRGNMKQQ